MATVLITGGTGMIGKALTGELIKKGYKVMILTRKVPAEKEADVSYAAWNVAAQTIDAKAIGEADYIVHLAGANVAGGRWTDKRKKEIVDSRVQSGALLVKALQQTENKVQGVISASAIGIYGPDAQVPNPTPFKETDAPSNDFLGRTCQQWEASIQPITSLDKRLAIFRIGVVLSNAGGAFAEFKKPTRFGVTSILGSGQQVISWIHIDDLVRLFIAAIEDAQWRGVYNAVAPHPVNNRQLMENIGKHKGFSVPVRVPALALQLALGEFTIEVLKSATVSAQKVLERGFSFRYPAVSVAVDNLMEKAS